MKTSCFRQTTVLLFALWLHIASASGATITISPGGMQFYPTRPTINVGDTVIWTQDGETHTVSSTAPPFVLNSGILSAGMTYTNTFTTAGTFEYRCNIHPSSPVAYVVVQAVPTAPPTFSFMSPSVAVPAGQELTFSVSASGTSPLIYQWVKDGVNVPGATNSTLTFTNVQPGNIGNYTVVVTNGTGSATSSVASLSIPGVNSGLWQGLVAYYPFNGNAVDALGVGNSGAVVGATLATDRFGQGNAAYSFNGVNSYITFGKNDAVYPNTVLTWAAWFRRAGYKDNSIIVWDDDAQGGGDRYIGLGALAGTLSDTNTLFSRAFGTLAGEGIVAAGGLPIGTGWNQVVLTADAGSQKLYFNGSLVASTNAPLPTHNGRSYLSVGSGHNGYGGSFNGSIDDVRIYNRALSATEVAQLYTSEAVVPVIPGQGGINLTNGLVAYYPFTGNAGDESGNGNHGTFLSGAQLSDNRFNMPLSAIQIDGIDGVNKGVKVTNAVLNAGLQQYTVNVWFNSTNPGKIHQTIFNTEPHNGLALGYNYDGTKRVSFLAGNGSAWITTFAYSASAFQTSGWHMATLVKNADQFSVFVDGGLEITTTTSTTGWAAPLALYFGSIGSVGLFPPGEVFSGKLDDIRIYNRALSTNEVAQLYTSEAVPSVVPTVSWSIVRTNPAVKLVVDGNGIYYLAQPLGVLKSSDQGQTWSTTSYNPPPRSGFNSIGGAVATPYGVFVGSLDQGIWRSTDAGTTWGNTFGTGFGTAARRMIYSNGSLLTTYGGSLRGIYKWNTSSQSWVQKITYGADFNDFTADDSGAIYATLTAGGSGAGGIYRSTDGGETWSSVYSTSYPNNPSVIEWWNGKLVAIRNNLGVVVSADRGTTWQSLSAVTGVSSSVDSAADMTVGLDGFLYASFYGGGVKRTADPAQGWTDYSQGLPTQLCRDFTVANGALFVATDAGLARLGFSVPAAPVITIQPTNVTASVGGSANFSVTVTGTAPLSYQWAKGGVNVPGATNATLAFTNVQFVNIGNYSVVVTNAAGSVTSSVASLTILGVPTGIWQGLVAYYPFNGNANDESGNGHHGVMTGGTIVADRFGNPGRALNLNGQGDFVTVAHSESLNLTNDLTLTAWVRIQDFPLFRQAYTLFAKRLPAGGFNDTPYLFTINFQYGIPTDYNQLMFVTAHGAGTYQYLGSAPGMVASNAWVQLVAMVETNRLKLFLGGALVTEQPVTPGSRFGNLAPLLIGSGARTDIPAEFFKGQLDDMRIYNRALSGTEIGQLYASESVPNSLPPDPAGSTPVATVSVFAGSGVAGNVNGANLLTIQLNAPNGLGFLSSGALVVADADNQQLRLIYPPSVNLLGAIPYAGSGATGFVDAVDSSLAQFNWPLGLFVGPGDDVFVADTLNNRIRRSIPQQKHTVSTVAGSGGFGLSDGPGGSATFNFPNDLVMDRNGNLFVSELSNHVIRKIAPGGAVSIFVGAGVAGTADGQGTAARLNGPGGIAIGPDDTMYVTEYHGNRIRKVTTNGVVTTIAGDGVAGFRDGVGTAARFNNPDGIVLDSRGDLYVTEGMNHSIRRITTRGKVETIAGNGTVGTATGAGSAARFRFPGGITFGPDGRLYVADSYNHRICAIQLDFSAPSIVSQPVGGAAALGGSVSLMTICSGTSDLAYQWRKGGAAISGATNTGYNLMAVQLSDAAVYDVVVTNAFGSVTSQVATVIVVPQIGSQPTNATANVGGSPAFTVSATGTGPLSYQWRKDGISVLGGATATLVLSNVQTNQAGNYTVVITNAGGSVTSSVAVLTVNRLGQSISFGVLGSKSFGDAPFPVSAAASSSLTVGFSIVSGPASLSGNTLTLTGVGTVVVRASQAGNATYNAAANVEQSFTVAKGSQTITFGTLGNRTFGDAPFTVNATATTGLTVGFSIVSGPATLSGNTITLTGVGTVVVRASQAGNANYNAAATVEQIFTVVKGSQTITFGALGNKAFGNATFTVGATTSAGLPPSFSILSGPATLSGNTVTLTGVGTVVVRAAQGGNGNYNAAATVEQSFTVGKGSQTITFGALGNKAFGDAPFTVSGTASSSLALSFSIISGPATLSGNTVTLTGVGTVVVRAAQAGNVNYNAAANVDQSFTVVKASQTITFGALGNRTFGDAPFTVSATTSAGLTVSFSILSGPATINGNTITLNSAGTVVVRAAQTGNVNYNAAANVDQSFTVAKASQTITFGALGNRTFGDAPFTVNATASAGLTVSFSILSGPATSSGNTITLTGAGTVVVRAAQAGNVNYNAAANVDQGFAVSGAVPFATRQLPRAYSPSSKFTVTIAATPAANVSVYAVEDVPPVGWMVGVINNGGSLDAQNGKVKFGPFFDATVRTLTYELTPPANATGVQTFAGIASANGVDTAVGGTATLDRAIRIPADNNPADDRITISEVTAYGTAWKTGATWPIDPNPIPINYVTRAGALWKGGETYRFDATVASAPLWWVNTGGMVPAGIHPLSVVVGGRVPAAVAGPGEAVAELAGGFQLNRDFAVTLRVRPGSGVSNYAVEETVPPGWTVKAGSLDQGGSFDGTSRKVKWGQFFDTQARVFTVVLEPGSNTAPVVFAGVASFDGVDVPFSGRRMALRGAFLPENVNAGRNVRTEGFRVVVQGEAGKRYDIQATETPTIPGSWVAVATNLDGAGVVEFTDLLATGRQARFYRVIER